jgi:signal transduction histidine kinase
MNKLTILIGYLEITKDKELHDPDLVRYLHTELEAARAIREQIQFTKFYQDIGVNNAVWQDIRETVQTAIGSLNLGGLRITTDLPAVEIFADPLLQKVFYNLMENSLRHGETLTRIAFSSADDAEELSIVYEDDGVGVPKDVKEKIFRREHYKNTGFGLFLTREILGITNITIRENGTEGQGARFEIRIPEGTWRYAAPGNSTSGITKQG